MAVTSGDELDTKHSGSKIVYQKKGEKRKKYSQKEEIKNEQIKTEIIENIT